MGEAGGWGLGRKGRARSAVEVGSCAAGWEEPFRPQAGRLRGDRLAKAGKE